MLLHLIWYEYSLTTNIVKTNVVLFRYYSDEESIMNGKLQ